MNNKKLSTLVLSTIVTGLLIASAGASYNGSGSVFDSDQTENKQEFRKGMNGGIKGLTAEEKTQVEAMTSEEKTAFLKAKKAEMDAEREAKQIENKANEVVIDKLLAGQTLTAEEETLRAAIITKRAERKIEQEAKKAEIEEIKTIMEKKKAGETLTTDEESKLKEMKTKGGKGHKGGMRGGERGQR